MTLSGVPKLHAAILSTSISTPLYTDCTNHRWLIFGLDKDMSKDKDMSECSFKTTYVLELRI